MELDFRGFIKRMRLTLFRLYETNFNNHLQSNERWVLLIIGNGCVERIFFFFIIWMELYFQELGPLSHNYESKFNLKTSPQTYNKPELNIKFLSNQNINYWANVAITTESQKIAAKLDPVNGQRHWGWYIKAWTTQ